MSVRIKASYMDDRELARLQRRLAPGIERCKHKKQQGRYKRAYIDWDSNVTNQEGEER